MHNEQTACGEVRAKAGQRDARAVRLSLVVAVAVPAAQGAADADAAAPPLLQRVVRLRRPVVAAGLPKTTMSRFNFNQLN